MYQSPSFSYGGLDVEISRATRPQTLLGYNVLKLEYNGHSHLYYIMAGKMANENIYETFVLVHLCNKGVMLTEWHIPFASERVG